MAGINGVESDMNFQVSEEAYKKIVADLEKRLEQTNRQFEAMRKVSTIWMELAMTDSRAVYDERDNLREDRDQLKRLNERLTVENRDLRLTSRK